MLTENFNRNFQSAIFFVFDRNRLPGFSEIALSLNPHTQPVHQMSSEYQIQIEALTGFLKELLIHQIDDSAQDWLLQKLELLHSKPNPRDLYLTFSAIPRFLGKNQLEISEPEEAAAWKLRKGLTLKGWSVSQTARVLALCTYRSEDPASFLQLLDQLFTTAEVTELVALYSALPVLPYPLKIGKEGIGRSKNQYVSSF